jgi:hypothetical protein
MLCSEDISLFHSEVEIECSLVVKPTNQVQKTLDKKNNFSPFSGSLTFYELFEGSIAILTL